jgi:PAS domain S-box-containing protein
LGGELLALGYLLTKSHQHSVEARAQQARRAAIVEGVNDAIIGTTLDGTVTEWNPAAERLFGYAAAEAVGRTLEHLIVPPERQAEAATVLERLRRGKRSTTWPPGAITRDGTLLDVLDSTAPIRDAAGRVIGRGLDGTRYHRTQGG